MIACRPPGIEADDAPAAGDAAAGARALNPTIAATAQTSTSRRATVSPTYAPHGSASNIGTRPLRTYSQSLPTSVIEDEIPRIVGT